MSEQDGEQPPLRKPAAHTTRVPPVLKCAYPNIRTLEEAIHALCKQAGLRSLPQLTRPGDATEYQWLLRRVFVSVPSKAPKLPLSTSFQQLSSLDEVLARALSQLFKQHYAPNNVLCYGVRRRRSPDARYGGGGGGVGRGAYN
jgi:telomerase reverse transcriptase